MRVGKEVLVGTLVFGASGLAVGVWWYAKELRQPATTGALPEVTTPLLQLKRLPELEPKWGRRATACESDADCVLSSYQDGSCCSEPCVSGNPVSKQFDEALRAQRVEQGCAEEPPCKIDICPPPCTRAQAVCERGRCRSETTELPCPERPACKPGDPLCDPT